MTLMTSLKLAVGASVLLAASGHAAVIATFDDLDAPPPLDSASGLQYTNATNSLDYQGVTWDADFTVVGDAYRVSASGPLFGIAHSGHYFVTNQSGHSGLTISTAQVLTGAWFGRNQYYGFTEGGADQITIVALSGRIDRRDLGSQAGHWVADDFQFGLATPVPEPGSVPLLLAGAGLLLAARRKRA
jgi:hypothetical protein